MQSDRHEENESNVPSQVARTQTRHDRPKDFALRNCIYSSQDPQAHNAEIVLEPGHLATVPLDGSALERQLDPTLESDQVFPPPPHPLVDSGGGQRFLVEPWDSLEPRAHLIVDVLGLVEQYDEIHPLSLKKGRRKTTSPEREYRDCKVSIPSDISKEMRAFQ
uniref:Uncharacterized protein n=1 Tax=Peronospora matthiolae TaxID=2874970 RepID=A0AAV1URI2_9STRA